MISSWAQQKYNLCTDEAGRTFNVSSLSEGGRPPPRSVQFESSDRRRTPCYYFLSLLVLLHRQNPGQLQQVGR